MNTLSADSPTRDAQNSVYKDIVIMYPKILKATYYLRWISLKDANKAAGVALLTVGVRLYLQETVCVSAM